MTAAGADEKQRAIMQWLSPVDSWESHEAATKAHQSGTSNWLIESEEFSGWHSADRSFLLLTGFRKYSSLVEWPKPTFEITAGAGKTILL